MPTLFTALSAALVLTASNAHAREVCSHREALCLQLPEDDTHALAERLAIAEQALGTLRILGLPQPAHRLERGLVVLEDDERHAATSPCERETRIVRAVLAASLARTGTDAVTTEALAASFRPLASPCLADDDRARTAALGREPELGWPQVAPSFLGWLDTQLGAAGPGRYLSALTSRIGPADLFAVLRENTKDTLFSGSTFGDTVAAFGVTRFVRGQSPAAWTIEWPSTPRALLLPRPLAPFGSAAIHIRVPEGRAASEALRIEASWEQHADLRIAVLALDGAGVELKRAWIPGRARIAEVQFTFREVEGARAIVLVLTSLGDPFAPLDTRLLDVEPHGAVVTLAGE